MSHTAAERTDRGRRARLSIRLVGDFEAQTEDGRSVLPVSKKARALLALVAAHMPQPMRRDFAASLLWSNKPKDHAANSLRQALRELQLSLAICGQPPILLTQGGRLMLSGDSVWIDIHDPGAIKWKPEHEAAVGPLLLCQNLHNLDPAFDAHLDRMWKNLVFQQAFTQVHEEPEAAYPVARGPIMPDEAGSLNDGRAVPAGAAMEPPVWTDDSVHGQGYRIAVLPFRSLGMPLDGGLSLSMAEEVSAALARFRMPKLIATGSFWDGTGPVKDALSRARAYHLDYAISGTMQASGNRIRVTVTLLDVGMDFEVIWASRFEGTLDDLFTLQDTIASQTVAQVDPELLQRHQYRGEAARTANSAAHQAVLTAIQGIYHPDKYRFDQAKGLLEKAITLDSDYAAAYAWLAYWYIIGIGQGWIADISEAGRLAGIAADRSIVLDPLDARGITIAGHVKAYMLHDLDAALVLHARAISLNPNLPIAWTLSSWCHTYMGWHDLAVKHANTAIALSPSDPHVFFVEHASMMSNLFLKDLEKADSLASSVLERKPGHASALRVRLSILGHLGRTEDAIMCLKKLLIADPNATVTSIIARPPLRQHDLAFYADGLRKAGAPE